MSGKVHIEMSAPSMLDRNISCTTAGSLALWILGLTLVLVSIFTTQPTAALGLLVAGGGGVLSIRGFLLGWERRQRDVFLLGRESAGVSPLR